jgi:hypothetical protein
MLHLEYARVLVGEANGLCSEPRALGRVHMPCWAGPALLAGGDLERFDHLSAG